MPNRVLAPEAYCGYFEVPLDWNDPSAGKGRLAVMKIPATRPAERKGVLFTQPGAVSGDGLWWLLGRAQVTMNYLVNGTYDLVSWDIRGTPNSEDFSTFPELQTMYVRVPLPAHHL